MPDMTPAPRRRPLWRLFIMPALLVVAAAAVCVVLVAGIVVATMMAKLELYRGEVTLSKEKQERADRDSPQETPHSVLLEAQSVTWRVW